MGSYQLVVIILILFALVVVVLIVAQWLNRRKFEKRRILMKEGPKVDRYCDPGKALHLDAMYSKDEARLKAAQWWERSGLTRGICGVCNKQVEKPGGYLISLAMVSKSAGYLERAIKPITEFGVNREEAIKQVQEQVMADQSPWLVCDECVGYFFA
jgi:hypothetical protein